jgi:hypothetical protein
MHAKRVSNRQPTCKSRLPDKIVVLLTAMFVLSGFQAASTSGFSSLGHQANLVFSDGDRSRWQINGSFVETEYSVSRSGVDWTANLRRFEPSGDVRWGYFGKDQPVPDNFASNSGRLSGRAFFFEPYTRASLAVGFPSESIKAEGEIRFREDDHTESFISLGVHSNPYLGMDVRHGRFYPFPSYSELYFTPFESGGIIDAEGGKLWWDIPGSLTDFTVKASYPQRVEAVFRLRDVNLRTTKPMYGDMPMGTYTGELYGGWTIREGAITVGPFSGWTQKLGYRQFDLDCDSLTAHDGGLKFAYFGLVEADGYMWTYAANTDRYTMAMNVGRAEGRIKGVLQAWPFLSGLYRFLGERRHFVVDGKLHWFHASASAPVWDRNRWGMRTCLSYLQVKPDFSYESWRPYFIGMGVDDLRTGQLELIRADLLRVQIRPFYKWSLFQITGEIAQWVPLHTKERPDQEPSAPSAGGDGEGHNVFGGFTASLVLTAEF